jgi:DnaJ family protein A protein 2
MNRLNNPYDILGLQTNATETEVRSAYKNLAKKHHPDKGGTAEKFKEINEAYTQIMKGEDPMETFPELGEIFKIFANFGGFGFGSVLKGPTIKSYINLTLEQIETGGLHTIQYKRNVPTGKFLTYVTQTPFGVMNTSSPEEVEKIFEITVNIPKCHDHKKPLLFSRLAKADNLPPGDLELYINLKKHPIFTRIGTLDLQTELNITLKESLIGFNIKIQLLNSDEFIKIDCKSIVNPYDIKRIPGYGMKFDENTYGDLLLKFKIKFPVLLTTETVNIINTLDDL